MAFKIFAGILSVLLLLIFVSPVVLKLKQVSLSIVVLIGVAMMITDIVQALRSKDD